MLTFQFSHHIRGFLRLPLRYRLPYALINRVSNTEDMIKYKLSGAEHHNHENG